MLPTVSSMHLSLPKPHGCRFTCVAERRSYYGLHVDDWNRFVFLGEHQFRAAQPLNPNNSRLTLMFPPVHDIAPAEAACIVSHQARYHLAIGFQTVYAYISEAMLVPFTAHPVLGKMVQQHRVQLVLWNDLPQCADPGVCTKVSALNHAIMALWGMHTHTLLVDIDELLALPPQMTLAGFMQRCVGNLSMAGLMRLDMVCNSCGGDDGELKLWLSDLSPFGRYTHSAGYELDDKAKSVLRPSDVHAIDIHMGDMLSGEYRLLDTQECGQLLHFENMFRSRAVPNTRPFTDWQWVLKHNALL